MGLFNKVKLQTPESIELEFTLAGIGSRLLALGLDYLVIFTSAVVLLWLWSFLALQTLDLLTPVLGETDGLELWLLAIAFLAFSALYGGYFILFEWLWQGQTPGKRIAHIRVVGTTGRPANLYQASLRMLLRPVDEFLFIGFFCILLQAQEQRLGDLVAGTLVVRTTPPAPKSFALSAQAQVVAAYLLETADLSHLHPDEFGVVRQYLQRRQQFNARSKAKVSLELAESIKASLGLQQIPAQTTADQFLEGVYLAYQGDRP